MSNGDDVLDNWEEIDEAGLDSKLNQINKNRKEPSNQNPNQETTQNMSNLAMSFHNSIPMMMVMQQTENEYNSSNYTTGGAMPSVKILRRPVQHNSASSRNNGERPKQPIKTLQQREQEYAEARLRILGSAKNPEDELESSLKNSVELLDTAVSAAITLPQQAATNASKSSTTVNYAEGCGVVKNESNYTSPTSSMMVGGVNTRYNQNVVRMPRGPDGTSGFQTPR